MVGTRGTNCLRTLSNTPGMPIAQLRLQLHTWLLILQSMYLSRSTTCRHQTQSKTQNMGITQLRTQLHIRLPILQSMYMTVITTTKLKLGFSSIAVRTASTRRRDRIGKTTRKSLLTGRTMGTDMLQKMSLAMASAIHGKIGEMIRIPQTTDDTC